jgi:adenylate kinase family enzyme
MLPRYQRIITPAVKVALASSFPVVFGPHVYLCKTEAARNEFLADAVPLSRQRPPQPPALQRIVVLGAPKSGKTSLSASIAKELGLPVIDACTAVAEVLEGISQLAADVKRELRKGQPLQPLIVAECVCAVARRYPGWVLDGFPATREQAELLASRQLGMTRVLVLEAKDDECKRRAERELHATLASGAYKFPTADSFERDTSEGAEPDAVKEVRGAPPVLAGGKAIDPELVEYSAEAAAIRLALQQHRDIEQCVAADGNRTRVQLQVRRGLLEAAAGRQAYLEKRCRGHPAPMLHLRLWMGRDEIIERRGRFSRAGGGALGGDGGGDYCPVSWKLDRTLVLAAPDASLSNMVQIGSEVVCVSPKHR